MVIGVPHDLELDLLVALDGLLHQHLMHRRQGEGVQTDLHQLFLVVGKAAAGAAQGEGGAQNHRVADALGSGLGLFQGIGDLGGDDGLADGLAQLLEQLPVLGPLDGGGGGAQQLYVAFLQHALLFQLHGQVQAGLAADAGNDGVGALIADNLGNVFQGQGLHIDLVGNGGVGHDGGGVRVAQHNLVALFLQSQAGLGAGVVKFGSLADDDGAGADDQNFLDVRSLCHCSFPPKNLYVKLCLSNCQLSIQLISVSRSASRVRAGRCTPACRHGRWPCTCRRPATLQRVWPCPGTGSPWGQCHIGRSDPIRKNHFPWGSQTGFWDW